MNWNKGFSATYYMMIVDPRSWRDIERVGILEGTINRENDSQSADITCTEYDTSKEMWVRVYLEALQGASGERHALFTGLATSPERDISGARSKYQIQCYSVLRPAKDVLLQRGWYAPSKISSSQIIEQLLEVCPCPIESADNAPALREAIIAEDGETNLSMVQKILTAIGWRMRILGDGTVQLLPDATEPQTIFDTIKNDVLQVDINVANDWFECPNVFRAVSDELTAIARDDSETSFFSTVNRGREVWAEESDCAFADGETIADYAMRRLKEEQSRYMSVSYDRRYHPDVYPTDLVRLHYPAQGIDGIFKVISQSIDLEYGATTCEEVSNG